MSEWKKYKLEDFADINPTERLLKGTIAKKIAMEVIQPFTKKIPTYSNEEYKGGVKFKNGDTIMARITPSLENGKTSYVDILDKNEIGFGSTEFIVFRAKEDVSDKHFVYYLTTSPIVRNTAIKSMTGSSGRQRVQTDVLKEHLFDAPELPEQKAIASVLSSLDDKIDLLHRQNKTLEAMAKTLFRQWFIEEAKEDWEAVSLGDSDLSKIIKSRIKKFEGEKIYLATGNVNDIDIVGGKLISYNKRPSRANMQPQKFSIWFAKKGGVKKLLMFDDYSDIDTSILSTGFTGLKTTELSHYYIWCFILSGEFQEIKDSFVSGTVQPDINNDAVLQIFMPKPNEKILKKFDYVAKPLFTKIQSNNKQIRTIEKLRDTLLPKLMSGEVRVNYEKETGKLVEDFISRHIEESMNPFKKAVLFSGVVAVMSDEKFNPDRVRVTKAGYFAKRYMGMDVLGEYSKMAAGPYDSTIRYKGPEKIAAKNGYVESVGKTQFKKGLKFHDAERYLEKYGYKPAIERLEQFKYIKNKELELLSTVDYAALDLMREGKDATAESIITYIKADKEWKKKLKEKAVMFNLEKVRWALEKLAVMFPKTYNKNLKGTKLNG